MSGRNAFLVGLLLVGLCYANSFPNDLILDDGPMVAANPAIRAITPVQFIQSPYWSRQQNEGIYRPFTIFSLSLDYAIWKQWVPGFRLTNLLLHALNGWLVFLLVQGLVGSGVAPISAMVIYLVHPVQTEAVTTIVGRSDLLAVFFLLSAWLLFRRGQTLCPALLFGLGLLSKESAIVFPALVLLDVTLCPKKGAGHFIYQKRVEPLLDGESRDLSPFWRVGVFGGVAAAYLLLRISVLGGLGIPRSAQYMAGTLSFVDRWMTSGRVALRYLSILIAPVNLAGDYDFNAIPIAHLGDWDAWIGLFVPAIALGIASWYRRRNTAISLGLLLTIIAMIPVSNWIMPISVLMAERFLYLPMVGLSLVGGVLFATIPGVRIRRITAVGLVSVAVLLCVVYGYVRRNDYTFYSNMVRVEPDSAKARLGLGFALVQAGRMSDATEQLEAGLRIIPNHSALLSTLALTKMTRNSCAEARPLLIRALEIDPNNGNTFRRMGDCFFREGRIRDAEVMYRRALEHIAFPDSLLLFMWGRSLEETGREQAAFAAYKRANLIDPRNQLIRAKLAKLSSVSPH